MTSKQFFKCYFQFAFNGVELRWVTPWFGLVIADGAKYYTNSMLWWGFDIHWSRASEYLEGELMFKKFHRTVFREIPIMKIYKNKWFEAYKQGIL